MQWEHLTTGTFEEAVAAAAGLCVLPCGVIEAHGPHLPLATDYLIAHRIAVEAARREPAVVFPPYFWGMNSETAHLPGGLVLELELVLRLLQATCDEIARNGFHRLVLYSAHGGDRFLHPLFIQQQLSRSGPYTLYWVQVAAGPGVREAIFQTPPDHAGEGETSLMLHLDGEHVLEDRLPPRPGTPAGRPLGEVYTSADWYGMFPEHYAGDARLASAEKGRRWFEACAQHLASLLRSIKEDQRVPAAYREYGQRLYRRPAG